MASTGASEASAALEQRFQFARQLDSLAREGLFRRRIAIESPQGAVVRIEGRDFLNFCSNDYLGLAADPRIAQALGTAAARYGTGSGASPLVCGRSRAHVQLEDVLAEFLQRDRTLVFTSGYLANLAVVSALLRGRNALVVEDRLNHASLIDAALLTRAGLKRYPHGDAATLQSILSKGPQRQLVLTDGVFSMDGDVAPISALAGVCQSWGALLMVDDAHGFGVLGNAGRGTLEEAGLCQTQVTLLMATFGKALGTSGAFVAGPERVVETIIQFARPYIYTTALPPALAVATRAALQIVREESWRRQRLQELIRYIRDQAGERGVTLQDSRTAIQPFIVGAPKAALVVSERLYAQGILVTPIRPPTVPHGTARLRITLTAMHTEAQIDRLLDALAGCLPEGARS